MIEISGEVGERIFRFSLTYMVINDPKPHSSPHKLYLCHMYKATPGLYLNQGYSYKHKNSEASN